MDGGEEQKFLLAQEPARFETESWHRLFLHANEHRASDLHITSSERVKLRVHGHVLAATRRRVEHAEVAELTRLLYQADNAELEILKGRPLDGAYALRLSREGGLRFRWNGSACQVRGGPGIKVTMRELPDVVPPLPVDELPAAVIDALYPDEGLSMVCGATGSGKTTLLAGIVSYIAGRADADTVIETLEAPIEITYGRLVKSDSCVITQREVPKDVPSFDIGVINTLRCDPDIIVVGESRDAATIKACLLAATTGHLVWTTVHSGSVGITFRRLADALPQVDMASTIAAIIDACRVVICQSLYPRIGGGRVAVRETLVFNDSIRNKLIRTAARNLSELPVVAQELVAEHGCTKLMHAQKLYSQGLIDSRYVDLVGIEAQKVIAAAGQELLGGLVYSRVRPVLNQSVGIASLREACLAQVATHGEAILVEADKLVAAGHLDKFYAFALHEAAAELRQSAASRVQQQ